MEDQSTTQWSRETSPLQMREEVGGGDDQGRWEEEEERDIGERTAMERERKQTRRWMKMTARNRNGQKRETEKIKKCVGGGSGGLPVSATVRALRHWPIHSEEPSLKS